MEHYYKPTWEMIRDIRPDEVYESRSLINHRYDGIKVKRMMGSPAMVYEYLPEGIYQPHRKRGDLVVMFGRLMECEWRKVVTEVDFVEAFGAFKGKSKIRSVESGDVKSPTHPVQAHFTAREISGAWEILKD